MMKSSDSLIQRLGVGIVVVVLVAALVFLWQMGVAAENGSGESTAVSTPSTDANPTTSDTGNAVDLDEAGDTAVPVISDNSIAPEPVPETYKGRVPEHSFETYLVQRGDAPAGIGAQFGITPETLLGGNPQLASENSLLQPGMELIILPVDGVLHDVAPGDTLESVSEQYGIPVEEIIAWESNNLEFPYRLYPDTQIMVPGAVRPVTFWSPPALASVSSGSREGAGIAPLIQGTGTFIYPVSSRNFSQRYWYGHRAIDIALPEGNAVFASDTGTVTYAGWNVYGYGNLVVVNHGNGFETFYAHLSGINVSPGQIVYQGNVIGATGNTGNSSGPHIHFEIRSGGNPDDPCWYIGC